MLTLDELIAYNKATLCCYYSSSSQDIFKETAASYRQFSSWSFIFGDFLASDCRPEAPGIVLASELFCGLGVFGLADFACNIARTESSKTHEQLHPTGILGNHPLYLHEKCSHLPR